MERRELPLLDAHAHQTALCTYCPKLCRPACPVSTVEGRETVTPWGKMRAADEVRRGVASLDKGGLDPAYACTGCMRCRTLCELDNPVAEVLRDARAAAFESNQEPPRVRAFVAEFPERTRSLAAKAAPLYAGEGPAAVPSGAVVYFPGCTRVARGELARVHDAAAMVARWNGAEPCIVGELCCGAPLLEAGDRAGFEEHARALAARLEGASRVVTPDAGCANALRVQFAALGINTPPVRHLSEEAAAREEAIPALAEPPAGVVYHDSCRLGRGLGVYDAPRRVLSKLLGSAAGELAENREKSSCSGAGGLLPVTMPGTAKGIAEETAQLARESGAGTVVTGCASARAKLAATGLRALELEDLLLDAGA